MSFVLDSSVTLAWCFEDEHTDATDALLERVVESGADAPLLWPLEILNGLMMAERRGRIAAGDRQRLAGFLRDLPVNLDADTPSQAWLTTSAVSSVDPESSTTRSSTSVPNNSSWIVCTI